jgi:predicted enzyme related to lactoylglutathione lyase
MRYIHINIIARDWKKLAEFYKDVFDCVEVPPERDLSGQWLDLATGLRGARIKGVHLRLPGYGGDGPTLEIFQYSDMLPHREVRPNTPGLTHLAFAVEDVMETRDRVVGTGGGTVGDVVSVEIQGYGVIEFAYVTDPEENIIEIQRATSI